MMNKTILALAIAFASCGVQAQLYGATKPIWEQRSMYRNIIVLDGPTHRCLTFGRRSGRQSCMEKGAPATKLVFGYTQRMFEAVQRLPRVERVLVIGIGGGSLPMALRAQYPDAQIDAVELDDEVISVARRFFNFRPDPKLSSIAGDGRTFVRAMLRASVRYDAILLDAFDKDYIPEHMATSEFLRQVQGILTPGGILLANTYKRTAFAEYEEATYQNVFGEIYEAEISNGNRIVIAGDFAATVAAGLPDARRVKKSDAAVMRDNFSPVNALLVR